MNQFFKTFAACLLAIAAGGFVLALIVFGIFNMIVFGFMSEETPVLPEKAVLKITFEEPMTDNADPDAILSIDPGSFQVIRPMSLLNVLTAIEKAKHDDRIQGIYFEPAVSMQLGIANLNEIRNALNDFKSSGKFVVSYADFFSQGTYYLASTGTVFLNPEGDIDWRGLAARTFFFKEALDKLEIKPEIVRAGQYKSAVEPFTETRMSEANRLQTTRMIGSIWNNIVSEIGASREIDTALLQLYASQLTVQGSLKALDVKMIDRIGYKSDVEAYIKEQTGDSIVRAVSLTEYIASTADAENLNRSKNKIAVVYAEGDIIDGKGGKGLIGSASFPQKLRKARKDKSVKAVVVRVNSPGGSALASETIWHEMSLLQQEKPVIVSMGSYAASGGYYISAPADVILCSPGTITGSIGVFGLMFDASEGLKNKLGISTDVVTTNPSADMGSPFRPVNGVEKQYLQNSIERIYNTFVQHVADGRNMSVADVDSIAEGRVWSGVDAVRIGLADGYGGLKEALAVAADRAGILNDFRTVTVSGQPSRLTQLLSAFSGSSIFGTRQDPILESYLRMRDISSKNPVQAALWAVPVIE